MVFAFNSSKHRVPAGMFGWVRAPNQNGIGMSAFPFRNYLELSCSVKTLKPNEHVHKTCVTLSIARHFFSLRVYPILECNLMPERRLLHQSMLSMFKTEEKQKQQPTFKKSKYKTRKESDIQRFTSTSHHRNNNHWSSFEWKYK